MIGLGYGWAEPPAFCSPIAYDVELAHAHVRRATLPAQYTRLMPQEPWLRAAAHFDLAAPGGTAFRFPELGDAGALPPGDEHPQMDPRLTEAGEATSADLEGAAAAHEEPDAVYTTAVVTVNVDGLPLEASASALQIELHRQELANVPKRQRV